MAVKNERAPASPPPPKRQKIDDSTLRHNLQPDGSCAKNVSQNRTHTNGDAPIATPNCTINNAVDSMEPFTDLAAVDVTSASSRSIGDLPTEMLQHILGHVIQQNHKSKQEVLGLRLVCKAFNTILQPKVLSNIQLNFHLLCNSLDMDILGSMADHVKSVNIDLSIVRDQSESKNLKNAFGPLAERFGDMNPVFQEIIGYKMTPNTFDEAKFGEVLTEIFAKVAEIRSMKLLLPVVFMGEPSNAASKLLAAALSSMGSRRANDAQIRTLVLGPVPDTVINKIHDNAMDCKNALAVFKPLHHLCLDLKNHEFTAAGMAKYAAGLWRFISEAQELESLSLTGDHGRRSITKRTIPTESRVARDRWPAMAIPYFPLAKECRFQKLMAVELTRVNISPRHLLQMLHDCSKSLSELYLNEVYLKFDCHNAVRVPHYWIGTGLENGKHDNDIWVVVEIKRMIEKGTLNLKVLRASGLGYDVINQAGQAPTNDIFDLNDPTGQGRCFDQRFVEAVLGSGLAGPAGLPESAAWSVKAYQRHHNTTSAHKSSLDGNFQLKGDKTYRLAQQLMHIVDRGMKTLTDDINMISANPDVVPAQPPATDGSAATAATAATAS